MISQPQGYLSKQFAAMHDCIIHFEHTIWLILIQFNLSQWHWKWCQQFRHFIIFYENFVITQPTNDTILNYDRIVFVPKVNKNVADSLGASKRRSNWSKEPQSLAQQKYNKKKWNLFYLIIYLLKKIFDGMDNLVVACRREPLGR